MHDKNKCMRCKYHRSWSNNTVFCNYASLTDRTCLTKVNGVVVDRRGKGECKLFEEGLAMQERGDEILYGGKLKNDYIY